MNNNSAITSFSPSSEGYGGSSFLTSLGIDSCRESWIERLNLLQVSIAKEIFPEARPTDESFSALKSIFDDLKSSGWKHPAPSSLTLNGDGGITVEYFRSEGNTDLIELDRDGSIERIQIKEGRIIGREVTCQPNRAAA